MALDVLPACPGLAAAADAAAGEDDDFEGVSDGELVGVLCAWDRVEAHAAARKLAAAAELIRRNPGPGGAPEGAARMPAAWDEFATDQLAYALAESRGRADTLLDLAHCLETRLPGTKAAMLGGTITRFKAETIVGATALLDPAEARAAEDKVLDRASLVIPGRAARRDRPRRHGGGAGQGEGAARDRGQERPGGAVGRGFRQRRPDGLRASPGPGAQPPTSGSPRGRSSCARPGWMVTWTYCAPAPTSTCCWAKIPAPAPGGAEPVAIRHQPGSRRGSRRVRLPGHPDSTARHPGPPG